jgi:hypothetical protein
MCRQYFEDLRHRTPGGGAGGAAGERALQGQLATLAGSGSWIKILGYCLRLPGDPVAGKGPWQAGTAGGREAQEWQNPGTGSLGTGGPGAPAGGQGGYPGGGVGWP